MLTLRGLSFLLILPMSLGLWYLIVALLIRMPERAQSIIQALEDVARTLS